MKFLLMCGIDEARWLGLPAAERDRVMSEYGTVVQDLKQNGRLLGGAKLDLCAAAVTVREKNGKRVVTDGPFAETKEQLGGYHVIECRDRDEAISIAGRIPSLSIGAFIEVRPIEYME